jgi:hypothetical protein
MVSTINTLVLFNTPFILQPELIQSCMDDNNHNNSNSNSNDMSTSTSISSTPSISNFCQDAMQILNLLNDINIEMEIEQGEKISTIKAKASMIEDWDGAIHPLPIITQFLTTPALTYISAENKENSNIINNEIHDRPIPYIQEYRLATKVTTKNPVKESKKELNKIINPKKLDCAIPGLRKHLHTVQQREVDGEFISHSSAYAPIIWFYNSKLHLQMLYYVIGLDIPWSWKEEPAIILDIDEGKGVNENSGGEKYKRFSNQKVVTKKEKGLYLSTTNNNIGTSMNDNETMEVTKKRLETILRSKIVIIPSTNSLQSMNELKWALYSKSVVLMPRPKITTFVMEERLEPYVHYVPLKDDYDEVEVQNQLSWILKNDRKARHIAERATFFIHDLFFHEDSEKDTLDIQKKILERYAKFFLISD